MIGGMQLLPDGLTLKVTYLNRWNKGMDEWITFHCDNVIIIHVTIAMPIY